MARICHLNFNIMIMSKRSTAVIKKVPPLMDYKSNLLNLSQVSWFDFRFPLYLIVPRYFTCFRMFIDPHVYFLGSKKLHII